MIYVIFADIARTAYIWSCIKKFHQVQITINKTTALQFQFLHMFFKAISQIFYFI